MTGMAAPITALPSTPSGACTRHFAIAPLANAPAGTCLATTVGLAPATEGEVYSPTGAVPPAFHHWKCAITALSALLTVARSVGVAVPTVRRPDPVTHVVDPSVVRFVGTAGTVLYTTVRVGLWRNFFQVNVSLADSYVDGARKPTVMLLHPPLAALTTCVVALNSTPPAGQLDEYPFATLLESIRYDHTGWLLQVVDDEIPPVAHSSTGRAVHERDQSS